MNSTTKLSKAQRRMQALLLHFERCEALGRIMGLTDPCGKAVSTALWKAEKLAQRYDNDAAKDIIKQALGKLPVGLFINYRTDGPALLMDSECPLAAQLLELNWVRDTQGDFILSPDIDATN